MYRSNKKHSLHFCVFLVVDEVVENIKYKQVVKHLDKKSYKKDSPHMSYKKILRT